MSGSGLTVADVVEATGARVDPPTSRDRLAALRVRAVSTDTRTLRPGDLFVALRGPHADGHAFIPNAAAAGAIAAVAAQPRMGEPSSPFPLLLVTDTLRALGGIAARYRQTLAARVVGITGSVGKTTTTALGAAVLARRYQVVSSEPSWNAEVGVPLTILRAASATDVIVTEMAMRGEGQIQDLVEIARPEVGVVTNIGESHLALLGTPARIAAAKGELIDGLPADGIAVLNADDPWGAELAARAGGRRLVWFGHAAGADVRGVDGHVDRGGTQFRLQLAGTHRDVRLRLYGMHNVANALAAAAVGIALDVAVDDIVGGLESALPPHMRLEVEHAGDLLILNDAYNASPQSVRAALDVLDAVAGGRRRVAILADMKELGAQSAALHERVGREAGERGLALLIAVGPEAKALAAGAREALPAERVEHVRDREAAVALLARLLRPDDAVLVKGSRAMRMEAVVEALHAWATAQPRVPSERSDHVDAR